MSIWMWRVLDEGEIEGIGWGNMKLPENQVAPLDALAEVNSNIVVVLSCGCAVEMRWDDKVNPSGKLSETVTLMLLEIRLNIPLTIA